MVLPSTPHADSGGAELAWTTSRGQTFITATDIPLHGADLLTGGGSGDVPRAHALADAMRATGAVDRSPSGRPGVSAPAPRTRPVKLAETTGRLLTVAVILEVVFGPRPRRATRWFWFWLAWLPLGLGVVGWFVGHGFDRGRAGRDADARISGWLGFAILLVGSIAVASAVMGLRSLLGTYLIPG